MLMDDLPDAVATLEAADEKHALGQALAGQERPQPDVDNHGAPPHPRAAVVLRLPASLMVDGRQVGAHDLRSASRLRRAEGSLRRGPDRVGGQRKQTPRIDPNRRKATPTGWRCASCPSSRSRSDERGQQPSGHANEQEPSNRQSHESRVLPQSREPPVWASARERHPTARIPRGCGQPRPRGRESAPNARRASRRIVSVGTEPK